MPSVVRVRGWGMCYVNDCPHIVYVCGLAGRGVPICITVLGFVKFILNVTQPQVLYRSLKVVTVRVHRPLICTGYNELISLSSSASRGRERDTSCFLCLKSLSAALNRTRASQPGHTNDASSEREDAVGKLLH